MSNKIKLALCVLVSCLLVAACSDSDKKSKVSQNGNVIFFHNIENAGELQLKAVNTSQRNSFGTVDFEQVSTMVYLPAQRWGVKLNDDKATAATGDDIVLLESHFNVPANSLRLIAFTGTYDGSTVPSDVVLHQLEMAHDKELTDSNAENIQFINVSHLHKGIAAVDVYVLPETEVGASDKTQLANFTPQASNIGFGQTSAAIRLENNVSRVFYVYVTASGDPTDVLFESGIRELRDQLYQTLLISPNYLAASTNVTSVFYVTNTIDEQWSDIAERKAEVRVLNTYQANLTANAVIDSATAEVLGSNLALNALSDFVELESDAITYFVTANDGTKDLTPQIPLYLMSAEQWTVIFYGDESADVLRGMKTKEDRALISNRAGVTISNASFFASTSTAKRFDVYFLRSGESFTSAEPFAKDFASGANFSKRLAGGQYQVFFTEAGNKNMAYSPITVTLNDNENYHFVIAGNEANKPFSICRIDVSNACVQY